MNNSKKQLTESFCKDTFGNLLSNYTPAELMSEIFDIALEDYANPILLKAETKERRAMLYQSLRDFFLAMEDPEIRKNFTDD